MQIIVNKTKLFRAIKRHIGPIPNMAHTRFSKAPDGFSYSLEWSTECDNYGYLACLSYESGFPELIVEMHDKQTNETKDVVKVRWNNIHEFATLL